MTAPTPVSATPPIVTDPRKRRAIMAVVAISLMMVVSAVSGLNVALPSLAIETGASQSELQWIVDAYTVVFAGLLLFTGAFGDRFGRRGTLMIGLVIFGAAAAAAFFVTDPGWLIALRAAMGVGAAFVMPTTLSVITTSFPPEERGKAVGIWVGVAGGGAVIGLFAAGLLLEWFNWNSFFALNVTLAAIALVGALLVVPTSTDEHPPALDPVSALLSLVGVSGIVFGIIEGPVKGWTDPSVWGTLALGVAALALFVGRERRKESPMLDPRLFRLRGFSAGSVSLMIQFFSAFGLFFILMQYLQFVVGWSPLQAAAGLLPLPFVLIPLARRTPHLAERFGFGRIAPIGLVSMALGFVILSRVTVELNYPLVAGGLIFFALGMAFAGAPATAAIVGSLPAQKQGVASSVNDLSREFGSALGIAVLGSVLNNGYRDGLVDRVASLPAEAQELVLNSIAFVKAAPLQQFGPQGEALAAAAKESFVSGVSSAAVITAVVLTCAAVFVALWGPRGPQSAAVSRDPEPGAATIGHTD